MGGKKKATLAPFLQALVGSRCIVELDNDTTIRGALETVDSRMNLMLKNVTIKDVYGRVRESESIHVRSGVIRYVHLPPNADPSTVMRTHARRLQAARREEYTRQQRAPNPAKGDGGASYDGARPFPDARA